MNENDAIIDLINLTQSDKDIIPRANDIFFMQNKYYMFDYSDEFRAVLLDVIAQEGGKEFKLSKEDIVRKLQKLLANYVLDKSKIHLNSGYTISDSADYFKEQLKHGPISDEEIIKEGSEGFGLSGFELNKYIDFIKSYIQQEVKF